MHREEDADEQCDQQRDDAHRRHPRGAIRRVERRRRLVREQPPPAAVGASGDEALGAGVEHGRDFLGRPATGRGAGHVVSEHQRVGAQDDAIRAVHDVDAEPTARLLERGDERARAEGDGEHAETGAAVLHHGRDGNEGSAKRRVVDGASRCEAILPCRLPPDLVALHEIGAPARGDGVEAVRFRDRDLSRIEMRQRADEERARGGRRLQGALGRESLLEVRRGGGGDGEARGARATLAGGLDHGGSEREHLRLALPIGEQFVDEQLSAPRGVEEARFALASREAVEREIATPCQRQNESGAAESRGEQKAALQRRRGARRSGAERIGD